MVTNLVSLKLSCKSVWKDEKHPDNIVHLIQKDLEKDWNEAKRVDILKKQKSTLPRLSSLISEFDVLL